MVEEGFPFWTTFCVSLGAFFLVNMVVTLLRPPPKPKFERVPPPILTISKAELDRILDKKPGKTRAEGNDFSIGTSESSSVASLEKHAETLDRNDDLLGNAEQLLQRASKLSGKAPRSLDKPKPGKGSTVYPKVIEVLASPSSTAEARSMTREDEEVKIAMAVSAFEAAVNRSREAHRRALAAEKERQARSRHLATTPGPAPPSVVSPLPTFVAPASWKPKHMNDVRPSSKPESSVGKQSKETTGGQTAKPKPTDLNPLTKPTAGGKQALAGKTKKSLSKARQNALRLATLSDEALAAMAKNIHIRHAPGGSTSEGSESPPRSTDEGTSVQDRTGPESHDQNLTDDIPVRHAASGSKPERPVSPPQTKEERTVEKQQSEPDGLARNVTENIHVHQDTSDTESGPVVGDGWKQRAPQPLGRDNLSQANEEKGAREDGRSTGLSGMHSAYGATMSSREFTKTPPRKCEQDLKPPTQPPVSRQETARTIAAYNERQEIERALTILEKYRQVREAARAKRPAPITIRGKKVEEGKTARKPVGRDDTPPRSNRSRDCGREAPKTDREAPPSTITSPQKVAREEKETTKEPVPTPTVGATPKPDKGRRTPVRSRPRTPVTVRRKSRPRLENLMS